MAMEPIDDHVITTFLGDLSPAWQNRRALCADASTRRYFRIHGEKNRLVMYDRAPNAGVTIDKFVAVSRILNSASLRAPEIYKTDTAHGLMLLEDFGDYVFANRISENRPLDDYRPLIDLLPAFAALPVDGLPAFNRVIYDEEIDRLIRFYLSPLGLGDDARAEFRGLWHPYLDEIDQQTHFNFIDFHVENIMVLADGTLGLIDFQDARCGHPLYDLASLADDPRRDLTIETRDEICRLGMAALGRNTGGEDASRAIKILSVQRLTKILGIFARMIAEGRPRYDTLMMKVWHLLMTRLDDDIFTPLRPWYHRHVPEPTAETLAKLRGRHD